MPLPASFLKAGLLTPEAARRGGSKFRGLMLATEGHANTGKTEFLMSAPDPGAIVCCDRGFDALVDNQTPPPTRRDFGMFVMKLSVEGQKGSLEAYREEWEGFYKKTYELIAIPELRTLGIDADNISYDTERLAYHGKLSGVYPLTRYGPVKAERRGFYHRLWESHKIIITTNQLKEEWIDQKDARGHTILETNGEAKQKPSGKFVAQGYPDQEYLWQIRIRHLFKPAFTTKSGIDIPKQWGLKILMCKANRDLEGKELWGDTCNFQSLVELVYPQVPLSEWGF